MKVNLKKGSSKSLECMAILFLLFMFANIGVSTAQAQETQEDYKLLWSYEMWINVDVRSISVSSDGSYIAAGSYDDKVYFFNRNGNLLWSYETGNTVLDIAVTFDGSYIAAGSLDDKVYFFNRNGDLLWSYETSGRIEDVSVSSDGSYIATGTCDYGFHGDTNKIYLFSHNGDLLWSYETGGWVDVSVSSDGSYIAAGTSGDDKVYFFNRNGDLLWSYETGDIVKGVKTGGRVTRVSVSSDGSYIAAGTSGTSYMDDKVYFFDRNGDLLWSYKTGNKVSDVDVAVTFDGSYIAAGTSDRSGRDNTIYLFNHNGELLWSYKTGGRIEGISVSSDGSYIAAGTSRNIYKIYLFNHNGELLWSYETGSRVNGISVSSDGSYIAAGTSSPTWWRSGKVYFFSTLAIALAIDIDQDGVLNEEDFAPTIKNNYIYAGGVVLTAAFTGAGFVISRNRKKRKEYRAMVSEYRAKIEQWKREGYDVSELEEMLK